jgi:hypothetical protein
LDDLQAVEQSLRADALDAIVADLAPYTLQAHQPGIDGSRNVGFGFFQLSLERHSFTSR